MDVKGGITDIDELGDDMKHDCVKKSDWDLIANKKIEDAEVTKIWKDTEGNIHVELTYPKDGKPVTRFSPIMRISKEELFSNQPSMISVIEEQMRKREK